MASRHSPAHHRSAGSAWALLLGAFLLVSVTAFTVGRAFSSSSTCSECAQATNSPRLPYKLHVGPAGATSSNSNTSSSTSSSSGSADSAGVKYAGNVTEHPVCAFFRQGADNVHNEHGWGPYDQCDMNKPQDWLKRARSSCYSCITGDNVCVNPPTMLFHQYLEYLHPERWEGNMLSVKSFLMTQNLARAHMYIWVPDVSKVDVANKTSDLFREFSDYVTVRRFDYADFIQGTPFKGDAFFGNGSLVKAHMPAPGSYSDIVRILVLNKYGGMWMDNDVVLYQDLTHLLSVSYQFVMRWMNLHIMRMEKGSPLMQRALRLATSLPLNHPSFEETIINKLCKPNGYYQIVAARYGYTDIYNGCLFRLLLRFNNTGPPDAVLHDMPLGWWDHDWKGCFNSRRNITDTKWREVATHFLAMHNRYPGDPAVASDDTPDPQNTPLSRVIRTVAAFWKACGRKDCTPVDGMSIMAYDGFDTGPPARHKRLLQQLLLHRQQRGNS